MTESVKATQIAPEEITKKDVTKAYLRWHFANEIPHSFERYLAPSLLWNSSGQKKNMKTKKF